MTDQEEYEQLKENEQKIYRKITKGVTPEEEEKLYARLDTIKRIKTEIRNRS